MIEIELKFELKNKLNINLKPDSIKEVEDIYYDTKDYKLLRNGNFLRIRNDKQLDFKLSANDLTHLYCNETNYQLNDSNMEDISGVLNSIGVDIDLKCVDDLFSNLDVLAPIKKKRTSYNLEENVVMVIDEVEDLGTFLEIEYDLDAEKIDDASYYENMLVEILKKHSLYDDSMRKVHIGYVELYLKKHNMEAYKLGLYQE